ncbi:hypothetical protein LINGRAHAP2_LOCUS2193 [Linum grandiflorum]
MLNNFLQFLYFIYLMCQIRTKHLQQCNLSNIVCSYDIHLR